MKSEITKFILLVAVSALSSLASAQDVTVSQVIKSEPLALSNVSVQMLDSIVNQVTPFGSAANLIISGDYNGGWCQFDSVGMQEVGIKNDKGYSSTILLFGESQVTQGAIDMTPHACGDGNRGKLSIPLKVGIGAWSSDQTQQKFAYSIQTTSGTKVIAILFDVKLGWSVTVQ